MENLIYINETQFISELSNKLEEVLNTDDNTYSIEKFKRIGNKELDLFIKNIQNNNSFTIEFKGNPSDNSIPPEILPSFTNLKNVINDPDNHFIIFTFSGINNFTKELFNHNGIEVFEYKKHKNNLAKEFSKFIKKLELSVE